MNALPIDNRIAAGVRTRATAPVPAACMQTSDTSRRLEVNQHEVMRLAFARTGGCATEGAVSAFRWILRADAT